MSIGYSNYIAEQTNMKIEYTEYIVEKMNKNASYKKMMEYNSIVEKYFREYFREHFSKPNFLVLEDDELKNCKLIFK